MEEFNKPDFEKIQAKREKAIELIHLLAEKHNASFEINERDLGSISFSMKFPFEDAEAFVTIGMSLYDWQTESDLTIRTMTTLPENKRGAGLGKIALNYIKEWANENKLNEIRATQVSERNTHSQKFWKSNGFQKGTDEMARICNDYIFKYKK